MIACRIGDAGGSVKLTNTDERNHSFADFERRDGEGRRVILEPGQVKVVPLNPGMVYLTTPRGVTHAFADNPTD